MQPLTDYLRRLTNRQDSESLAKIFIAMTISEWNRSMTFSLPMPTASECANHAVTVAKIFVGGIETITSRDRVRRT